METTRSPLHPLLTVAAISVTVLSAAGVAALTGLIPQSVGSATATPPAFEAPQRASQPLSAAPVSPSAPVKKPAVRKVAPPKPVEPAVQHEFQEAPRFVEAPKPPLQLGIPGVVESVREVKDAGESKGVGVIAGGLAGGVLGNKVSSGSSNTRKVLTLLGVAGGAWAGNQIEKQARATKHWELTVRLDDGSTQKIRSESEPFWHAGDRVRLLDGKLQPV